VLESTDGTRKFLLTLDDGLRIETVLIPDVDRLTLCVSTQVGCMLDCGFCLTGTMGLKRNLKAHEIVDQVLTAQDHLTGTERLTNLVFMGMGSLANTRFPRRHCLPNQSWGLGWSYAALRCFRGLAARLNVAARGESCDLLEWYNGGTAPALMPAVSQLRRSRPSWRMPPLSARPDQTADV
jgi:23S rRNA (adenine2503-C2)-methyltransferase